MCWKGAVASAAAVPAPVAGWPPRHRHSRVGRSAGSAAASAEAKAQVPASVRHPESSCKGIMPPHIQICAGSRNTCFECRQIRVDQQI